MVGAPDIPGYTLLGVLGHGGFSTVYRAHQHSVDREVAVKVDNRVLAAERDRRRYLREVSAAGRLSGHPHVVAVFDAGTLDDGRPYLVMDLCPGGSLDQLLRRQGPLPVDQVLGFGGEIADALAAAHDVGVLHRDIKPGNLLIGRYGRVGLADFGLASILSADREQSVTREALTPAYAPPESFRLAEPSVAADLYSLGATLYALLAGRPPRFPDGPTPSIHTIMQLHDQPIPDLPGVPAAVTAVLRRAMDSDPARRQPSAAALRDELAALGQLGPTGPARARPVAFPQSPPADPWAVPRPAAPADPSPFPAASAPPAAPTPAASGPPPASAPFPAGPPAGPAGPTPTLRGPDLPTRQAARAGEGARSRLAAPAAAAAAVLALGGGLFVWLGPSREVPVTTPSSGAGSRSSTASGPGAAATGAAGSANGGTAGTGAAAGTIGEGSFAVAVTGQGCPAAKVEGAAAACPADPECWAGTVDEAGSVTARSVDCVQTHTWETFAVLPMPDALTSWDSRRAEADPVVRSVCTGSVLLASLPKNQDLPTDGWSVGVLPPSRSEYQDGSRVLRCLGGRGLDALTGPALG